MLIVVKDGHKLEDGERTLYFDVTSDSQQTRNDWLVAINNKIALLKYQKKMRDQGLRDNVTILEFFDNPDVKELYLDSKGNQEPINYDAITALAQPIKYHTTLQVLSLKGKKER